MQGPRDSDFYPAHQPHAFGTEPQGKAAADAAMMALQAQQYQDYMGSFIAHWWQVQLAQFPQHAHVWLDFFAGTFVTHNLPLPEKLVETVASISRGPRGPLPPMRKGWGSGNRHNLDRSHYSRDRSRDRSRSPRSRSPRFRSHRFRRSRSRGSISRSRSRGSLSRSRSRSRSRGPHSRSSSASRGSVASPSHRRAGGRRPGRPPFREAASPPASPAARRPTLSPPPAGPGEGGSSAVPPAPASAHLPRRGPEPRGPPALAAPAQSLGGPGPARAPRRRGRGRTRGNAAGE